MFWLYISMYNIAKIAHTTIMSIIRLMPGDIAPQSGLYNVLEADGIIVDKKTVGRGHRFPPTAQGSQYYELA